MEASKQMVWRALKRSGFSMKQVSRLDGLFTAPSHPLQLTKAAIERSAIKQAEYTAKIGWRYSPEQLVFLDESACNRKTTYRNRAWAIQGRRAMRKAFFVRGIRLASVLECCAILSL